MLASLCISATVHAAPSVAVDLSRLDSDAAPDAAVLEQAVVMRLLQEGFAIDPLTAEPAIVVAIAGDDRELVLSAKSAHFERSRTIAIAGSTEAELQLEVVQKVVELARLARESAPPPVVAVREPAAEVREVVVPPEPRRPRWLLGMGLGVDTGAVFEASLHARFAIARGIGAVVRAAAAQPDETGISVGEQELLLGASYEHALASIVAVDVGLLAGVRRHSFELAMPLAERTGTRFDAAAALPVRIVVRPSDAFEVSLWVIARVSREREHVLGDEVLWRRGAVTGGAGVGVAARF